VKMIRMGEDMRLQNRTSHYRSNGHTLKAPWSRPHHVNNKIWRVIHSDVPLPGAGSGASRMRSMGMDSASLARASSAVTASSCACISDSDCICNGSKPRVGDITRMRVRASH
jgi:hypothetical protein